MNKIFIIVGLVVTFLIIIIYLLFFILSYKIIIGIESSSGYECGFNFISKTRISFSYRFFLIGILFLIFDVEVVLLLSIPFLITNEMVSIIFILFIIFLIIGLLYEYYCGSLEWVELFISKA